MNISTISSPSAIGAIAPVQSSSVSGTCDAEGAGAASASISKPGELMSKLQQLQQQDPAKLKEVAAQLSKDLKSAAQNATGPDAERLNKLADGLSKVSTTGDVSALQPTQKSGASGAHHHSHHHHGGAPPSSDVASALSSAIATVSSSLVSGAATAATDATSAIAATS